MANWVSVSIAQGHVFYRRLKDTRDTKNNKNKQDKYWHSVAAKAEQEFSATMAELDKKYTWSTAADELMKVAMAERAKEKFLLKEIFGDSNSYDDNPYAYVKAINDSIGLRSDTANLLSELNKYMEEVERPGSMKSMAPGLFQHFEGYINSAITKQLTDNTISKLILTTWMNEDKDALEALLRKQVKIAVENALQNALDKAQKGTDAKMYPELSQALAKLTVDEKGELIKRLYNKYNLDEVIENIQHHLDFNKGKIVQRSRGDRENKYRNLAGSIARDAKFSTQAGAFAEESLTTLTSAIIQGTLGRDKVKVSGRAITQDMSKADAVQTYKISLDLSDMTELVDTVLKGNTSLKQSRVKLENALSGLKEQEGVIVYTNAKQYRLGKDFSSYGFSGGSATDLAQYGSADISGTLVAMRNLLVNTQTDALFENEYSNVRELITRKLSAMIGNLLFDDWTMIGDEAIGLRAIHVFQLDEIYLPLSFVCEQLAYTIREAQDQTTRWIRFKFYRPKKLKFPNAEDTTEFITQNGTNLQAAWEEQRQAALTDNLFEFHFMSNFKDILKQIMQEYGVK